MDTITNNNIKLIDPFIQYRIALLEKLRRPIQIAYHTSFRNRVFFDTTRYSYDSRGDDDTGVDFVNGGPGCGLRCWTSLGVMAWRQDASLLDIARCEMLHFARRRHRMVDVLVGASCFIARHHELLRFAG
jgi:hypothetical protein